MRGKTTDRPLPANAELVVEGYDEAEFSEGRRAIRRVSRLLRPAWRPDVRS